MHHSTRVSVPLVQLALGDFPRLMGHPTNREDALQELALVELASEEALPLREARQALAWLEYELGLCTRKPAFSKPFSTPPPEIIPGTFLAELEAALDSDPQAA